MKVAVIDIGTNTFNLLICSFKSNHLVLDHVEKDFVFLGKGGINKNLIVDEAIQRGITCLKKFKTTAQLFQVDQIIAIATSAVRNASNGKQFINQVKIETEIEIQVIAGSEEAKYIYHGARAALNFGSSPILLMDVGGGSTEFIIANNKEIIWKQSFEVGASRLFERFHHSDPISTNEIAAIENYLLEFLQPVLREAKKHNISTLVGSSGAFTSFAKMVASRLNESEKLIKTPSYHFNLLEMRKLKDEIIVSNLEERLQMKGLIKERAPMIVVGIVLVNFILEQLQISNFKLARFALKEGAAFQHFNQIENK